MNRTDEKPLNRQRNWSLTQESCQTRNSPEARAFWSLHQDNTWSTCNLMANLNILYFCIQLQTAVVRSLQQAHFMTRDACDLVHAKCFMACQGLRAVSISQRSHSLISQGVLLATNQDNWTFLSLLLSVLSFSLLLAAVTVASSCLALPLSEIRNIDGLFSCNVRSLEFWLPRSAIQHTHRHLQQVFCLELSG